MGFFSEVARRRIAAVILIVGIALVVLAITDTAFFDDPPTEEEKVSSTVSGFFDAAAQEDFERACALLTEQAQELMRQAAERAAQTEVPLGCAQIMKSVVGDSFAKVTVRVKEGEDSVSISGNRARAEAALKPDGEPSTIRTILLEENEEGSGWLISDFG